MKQYMTVTADVYRLFPSRLEGTLAQMLEKVQELIIEFGADTDVDFTEAYDDDDTPMFLLKRNRLETDAEYEKRTTNEAARQARQDRADLIEFKRLTQKFG
jgi:hypothetical protein